MSWSFAAELMLGTPVMRALYLHFGVVSNVGMMLFVGSSKYLNLFEPHRRDGRHKIYK